MKNENNIKLNITNSKIVVDSECGKDLERKKFTPIEILVGFVIPFVLFWGGMLSSFFSDRVFVWVLALIPLYGYMFLCILIPGKKLANAITGGSLLNLLTSLILVILLFIIPEDWIAIGNACRLSLINLVPAFVGVFFCATNGFVESIKGAPFPVFPFFIDGGS